MAELEKRDEVARQAPLHGDPGAGSPEEESLSVPRGTMPLSQPRASHRRRHWLPTALAGSGGAAALAAGLFLFRESAPVAGLLLLAGALALAGTILFVRQTDRAEQTRAVEIKALQTLRSEVGEALGAFERKRQRFEARLLAYGEWMEFPDARNFDQTESDDEPHAGAANAEEAEARIDREKAVAARVEEAADHVFAKLRSDAYARGGAFEPRLLLDDAIAFVEDIARIHRPDAEHPLLTSDLGSVLSALERVLFQLRTETQASETGSRSLASAYGRARTAGRLHGYYRAAKPYLPTLDFGWERGRLALRGSPLTTGTWMLDPEVLRQAGGSLASRFGAQASLQMVARAFRLLADEASVLFDAGARRLDPAWIYGVELVELAHHFPLSPRTLQEVLDEIGKLPLRSAHDRAFLYRAATAHRSSHPESDAAATLSSVSRRDIAQRLESFFRQHVRGRRPDLVETWRAEASERLGLPLRVGDRPAPDESRLRNEALQTLAGHLAALEGMSTDDLAELLASTRVASEMDPGDVADAARVASPILEFPDLEPGSALLDDWLADFLEGGAGPPDLCALRRVRDATAFYRISPRPFEKALLAGAQDFYDRVLAPDAPERTVPRPLVFTLPLLLRAEEEPRFFHDAEPPRIAAVPAAQEGEPGWEPLLPAARWWLIGTDERLLLAAVDDSVEEGGPGHLVLAWSEAATPEGEDGNLKLEQVKGVVGSHVRLLGGRWHLPDGTLTEPIRLAGTRLGRFERQFSPLLRWLGRPPTSPDGTVPIS